MFSSDPLSHGLAGDGHDSMNYGMIATGNHQYSNSLRGAPPLVSKGSLSLIRHGYAVPPSPEGKALGERIVTGGNPWKGPRQ